ncbi:MAG TPA: M48 family metallopeptidase [Methylomirabilota bacterium]|jgi:predicted Zn-dependent protease
MTRLFSQAATAVALLLFVSGCSLETAPQTGGSTQPQGGSTTTQKTASTRQVDPRLAERLQTVMTPLLRNMDHPIPLNQVKVGIMDDPHINAANAGGGEFYVTTGLLEKANDDQLRAVLAHETAHADLGHVTKLKTLGAGLNIGMVILDQIIPGSGALTPLAGQLIANAYTRKEEYEADAHGVTILRRAGYDGKTLMANTLTWLQQTEGGSGGGFFATHPATGDRIQAVRDLK